MDKFNLKNIKEHPVTSLIGFFLIISGCVTIYMPDIPFHYSIEMIVFGIAFLGIKDPRLPGGGKMFTATLMLGLLLLWCTSCCERVAGVTITKTDTLKVEVPVVIPPDTIKASFNIDSLLAARPGEVRVVQDPNSRAQLRIWKDKYNNLLNVQAECKTDTIKQQVIVPYKVAVECPPYQVKKKGKMARLFDTYKDFSAWLVALGIVFIIIFLIFKAIRR